MVPRAATPWFPLAMPLEGMKIQMIVPWRTVWFISFVEVLKHRSGHFSIPCSNTLCAFTMSSKVNITPKPTKLLFQTKLYKAKTTFMLHYGRGIRTMTRFCSNLLNKIWIWHCNFYLFKTFWLQWVVTICKNTKI